MNESKVVQWLGMICLLAGIARIGMTPTAYIWGTDSIPELIFGYIACILMSVGTIAIYQVQSRETGVLGFISTLAMIIGNIMTTALVFTVFIMDPASFSVVADNLVVVISRMGGMIGLTLGTLVFAIVTFRAKVFPRWVPFLNVLMIVSMFLPLADNKLFALFWGLTYVGMGFCIWTGKLKPRAQQEQIDMNNTVGA